MAITNKACIDVMIDGASRYAKYVSLNRQFADYRDGLLPAHRCLVWGIYEINRSKEPIKCARIVGDVLGKYHPHGDSALYGALCSLTKDESVLPIVEGEGNFGNLIDPPAGYRYPEAMLTKFGKLFVSPEYLDIIPFVSNYDGKERMPVFLPSLLPNILLNGTFGIGYGEMAKIPAFTLSSVKKLTIKAFDKYLTGADCRILEPAFVNGAVYDPDGSRMREFFDTGKGTIRILPVIETHGKDLHIIGLEEISYETFAEKLNERPEVRTVSNSSKDGKIVITVQCNSNVKDIHNLIFNMLTVTKPLRANVIENDVKEGYEHDNETLPSKLSIYNIPELLNKWVSYRIGLEEMRLSRKLDDAEKSMERTEALIAGAGKLEQLAALLVRKLTTEQVVKETRALLKVSEYGAQTVLNTPIIRLANLSVMELKETRKSLEDTCNALEHKIRYIDETTKQEVIYNFSQIG